MRILVTFAVDWEFRPWMRLRPFHPVADNGHVFRTEIAGGDVRVCLTGIGPHVSARSVRKALDEVPDLCITSGLTGGLKSKHKTGEVLVARAACSEIGGDTFESDKQLFDTAGECGAKAVNLFVSAARVIRTAKQKSTFHPSADAVDMESFVIMKEMATRGVPCVAIRSVSDSAEADLPCDFDRALDASGRIRITRVLGQIVCNPRQAWPLARFGARSSLAASSLARYLDRFALRLLGYEEKLVSSVQQISR